MNENTPDAAAATPAQANTESVAPASNRPRPGPPRTGNTRPYPKGVGYQPQDKPQQEKKGGPPAPPPLKQEFVKPSKRELDRSIEEEMAAAFSGMDLGGAIEKIESSQKPALNAPKLPGGRKRGTVVSLHGKDVFIEVPGGRSQGVMSIMQFEGNPPKVGDVVEFMVDHYDHTNGLLILNREGAAQSVSDFSSLSMHMIVEAKVTGVNKNRTGVMVEVNGLKGFMPISQIDMYRVENPDTYVNQTLKCEVIELNREERNLIVSRRSILERERQAKLEEFWSKIHEGECRSGVVRSIKPFGVFVDLDGADGMIPISELSWQRVKDPSELVNIGQRVEVYVKRLDTEQRRISLSLRHLLHNPWDEFANKHRPGSRISGTVSRIMEFGAFVELAPGIEGLIHVTELSTQRIRKVRDAVTEGQNVEVQILTIDAEQKRIGLSLKTIMAGEEAIQAAAAEAERVADAQEAEERMNTRKPTPGLRGGIGTGSVLFDFKTEQ